MVDFIATVYVDPLALKTAVDAIANTVVIHVVPFMEHGKQKFLLIT